MSIDTVSTFLAVGRPDPAGLRRRGVGGPRRRHRLDAEPGELFDSMPASRWQDRGSASPGSWRLVAMLGSLYYSEVAGFMPCEYCWYQRIAMYPLVVILGIAIVRRDDAVRRYVFALAIPGGIISAVPLRRSSASPISRWANAVSRSRAAGVGVEVRSRLDPVHGVRVRSP